MKRKTSNYKIVFFSLLLVLCFNCKQDVIKEIPSLKSATLTVITPTVTTLAVSSITSNSAVSGGNITLAGGSPITARGVCWNTSNNPTIANSKTVDGAGVGSYSSLIAGLKAGTTYYVRAYATNSGGTAYGSVKSLKTTSATLPSISTQSISVITSTTAIGGGNIANDGGATVTSRGVCWSTKANPTTANSKTLNGTGTGSFISYLTGLSAGTTYYVRAYAVNSKGTAYGTSLSFKTNMTVTDADGNVYNAVTIGTQVWMVENLKTTKYNDGTSIPNVTDNLLWGSLVSGAYCWNNNDVSNKAIYGGLYNWYAVGTGKLCPSGWHVPTDTEWTTLITYLGGESVAGGKMKETGTIHWASPNTGATNSSGFTCMPSGYRDMIGGFVSFGDHAFMWSSTMAVTASTEYWFRYLDNSTSVVYSHSNAGPYGFSIRCIKD